MSPGRTKRGRTLRLPDRFLGFSFSALALASQARPATPNVNKVSRWLEHLPARSLSRQECNLPWI
jgi:hypothetical protein